MIKLQFSTEPKKLSIEEYRKLGSVMFVDSLNTVHIDNPNDKESVIRLFNDIEYYKYRGNPIIDGQHKVYIFPKVDADKVLFAIMTGKDNLEKYQYTGKISKADQVKEWMNLYKFVGHIFTHNGQKRRCVMRGDFITSVDKWGHENSHDIFSTGSCGRYDGFVGFNDEYEFWKWFTQSA